MPRAKSDLHISYEAIKSLAETYLSLADAATIPQVRDRLMKTAEKLRARAMLLRPESAQDDAGSGCQELE